MNEYPERDVERESAGHEAETRAPASEATANARLAYVDPRGSQSTRDLRDTARRRRDAEEKLQQHLMEAKEHAHRHEDADLDDDQDRDEPSSAGERQSNASPDGGTS